LNRTDLLRFLPTGRAGGAILALLVVPRMNQLVGEERGQRLRASVTALAMRLLAVLPWPFGATAKKMVRRNPLHLHGSSRPELVHVTLHDHGVGQDLVNLYGLPQEIDEKVTSSPVRTVLR